MRIASLLIACAALAGGLVGCVGDNGPSLFISANLSPDEDCVIAVDNAAVARGRLNVEYRDAAYVFAPLYNNSLIKNESTAPPRPDPNGLLVDGAEIEIMDSAGTLVPFNGLPNPFTVRNTQFVPSSDGLTTPGVASGVLDIVPPAYVQDLDTSFLPAGDDARAQLLINIKPFGETLGHTGVDGREFLWPIDICRGRDCLFFPAAVDEELNCCLPGQDTLCPDSLLPAAP